MAIKGSALLVLQDAQRNFFTQFRDSKAPLYPLRWSFFGCSVYDAETPIEAAYRDIEQAVEFSRDRLIVDRLRSIWKTTHPRTGLPLHIVQYVGVMPHNVRHKEGAGVAFLTIQELKTLADSGAVADPTAIVVEQILSGPLVMLEY